MVWESYFHKAQKPFGKNESCLYTFMSVKNFFVLSHFRCWVILSILMFLFFPACSLKHPDIHQRDLTLTPRTVALISAPTYDEATQISTSLQQGGHLPKSARLVSLKQLDQISPLIAKLALQLKRCEVSSPLEDPSGTGYLIMMIKNDSDKPCKKPKKPFSESIKNLSDTAGQIMIGLLLVGGTAFLAALPFLF